MWISHAPTTVSHPLSVSSACALPHPGERLGAGCVQAGWGAAVTLSHLGFPDVKRKGELALGPIQGCRTSAASSPPSLPPQTASISICQQLVEGQTDTCPLPTSPLPLWYPLACLTLLPLQWVRASGHGLQCPASLSHTCCVHGVSVGCR